MYEELIDSIDKEEDKKVEIIIMNFYIKDNEPNKMLEEFYEERDKLMKKYDIQWLEENGNEDFMEKME